MIRYNKGGILLILVLSFFYLIFSNSFIKGGGQDTNIALNKDYTFSQKPNYREPNLSVVEKSLTDGIKSYESDRSFWMQKTTAGWSNIKKSSIVIDLEKNYLINAIKFNTVGGGKAGVHFPLHVLAYVSNDGKEFEYVGDLLNENISPQKSYVVKNLDLKNINLTGRYVRLDIIPNGSYAFCNEIEVYGTTQNIVKTRQSTIEETGLAPFVVEKSKPWGSYFHLNIPEKDVSTLNYDYILANNTSQLESVEVTNTSGKRQTLSFDLSNSNIAEVQMFEAPFIDASKAIDIIDPLLTLSSNSTLEIKPGETKVLYFKITGLKEGDDKLNLQINSTERTVNINFNLNVVELPKNTSSLNAVNWAYFFRPILSGRKTEAINDLEAHNINTYVIASRDIPDIDDTNFSEIRDYVSDLPRDSNLLLYLNFKHAKIRNISNTIKFMEDDWKPLFKEWYKQLLQSLTSMGFNKNNIYFYPYDEPNGDDVTDYLKFAQWGKQNVEELQLFSTVSKKEALALKQYVDIICISEFLPFESKKKAAQYKKGSWVYTVLSRSRDRNPYMEYRLMGWKAFYYDLKGVGFWNYATLDGRPGNNLITGTYEKPTGDYSVIYTKQNNTNIITSRRWEAFSIGLEDYKIISAYANRTSVSEAKEHIFRVINNPHNYQLADSLRQKMLNEIK